MITEPMTLATDYLITIFAIVFAVSLRRAGNRWWSYAFLATATGSFLGGTHHGFAGVMSPAAANVLWQLTVYAIGVASLFVLLGVSKHLPALRVFAFLKFVAYMVWISLDSSFIWVIVDYGTTLLIVAALQLAAWIRRRDPAAPWILASIGVSIIGAAIQALHIAPHRHFNHNDLYHVIQIFALWLMMRGGVLMVTPVEVRSG